MFIPIKHNYYSTEIDIVLHFTQGGGYLIEVDRPCDCLSVYHSVCVTISLITTATNYFNRRWDVFHHENHFATTIERQLQLKKNISIVVGDDCLITRRLPS